MTESHLRFGTITGVLHDYVKVTGINGDGSHFQAYFLQVKVDSLALDAEADNWPQLERVYLVLDDFISDTPTLGDRVEISGELGLTHLALDGQGVATASAIQALYQRVLLYADNWAEVNLINQKRRQFDALTTKYAGSPWEFDQWLTQQQVLLPDVPALTQLQQLLTTLIQQRGELFANAAPITALLQNPTSSEFEPGGIFEPPTLGHWNSDRHLMKIFDETDKKKLHDSLLKQSRELARRRRK